MGHDENTSGVQKYIVTMLSLATPVHLKIPHAISHEHELNTLKNVFWYSTARSSAAVVH